MTFSRISCIALVALVTCSPVFGQARQGCLHGAMEARAEEQRRTEALTAARLINSALVQPRPSGSPYPSWEQLGNSAYVASLRGTGGPIGDLARKMLWGTSEPLPGWQVRYVAARAAYAFSLRDQRDPCGFGYASDESGVVAETYPVQSSGIRIVPLETR